MPGTDTPRLFLGAFRQLNKSLWWFLLICTWQEVITYQFIRFCLKLSTQRVDNPMFYLQQKKREKRNRIEIVQTVCTNCRIKVNWTKEPKWAEIFNERRSGLILEMTCVMGWRNAFRLIIRLARIQIFTDCITLIFTEIIEQRKHTNEKC